MNAFELELLKTRMKKAPVQPGDSAIPEDLSIGPKPQLDATSPEGIEAALRSRMRPNPAVDRMRQGAAAAGGAEVNPLMERQPAMGITSQMMAPGSALAMKYASAAGGGQTPMDTQAPAVDPRAEMAADSVPDEPGLDSRETELRERLATVRPTAQGGTTAPPPTAEDDLRSRMAKRKSDRMWQGIGEGAQDVANAFRSYAGQPKMAYSQGAQREMDDADDVIAPEMVKQLKDYGIDVPDGTRYSEVKQLTPIITQLARNQTTTQRADEKARLIREEHMRKEAKLSDRDTTTLNGFDTMLELLESIKRDKDQFDTGWLAGPTHTGLSAVGMSDPKKDAFKSQVVTQFNDQLRMNTGTAVSPGEVARLQAAMPTMNDNDKQFIAKLESVQKQLKAKRDVWLQNKQRQGKDISEFTEGPATGEGVGGEQVKVQTPDGKVGSIPLDDYKKAVADGSFQKDGWKKL